MGGRQAECGQSTGDRMQLSKSAMHTLLQYGMRIHPYHIFTHGVSRHHKHIRIAYPVTLFFVVAVVGIMAVEQAVA